MSHGTSFEIDCTTLPRLSWSCLTDIRRLLASNDWRPYGKAIKQILIEISVNEAALDVIAAKHKIYSHLHCAGCSSFFLRE